MNRLYCDRCGKEIEGFNKRRYNPIADAANGEDKFFTISVYNKYTCKPLHSVYGDEEEEIDEKARYEFNTPDLCIDCMKEINKAVKTVWDGVPMHEKVGDK